MKWPYREYKEKARYLFTGYTGILAQAMLIYAAALLAAAYVTMAAGTTGIIAMLISLITSLFCQMLNAGRIGMVMDCGRSGQVKVSDVFTAFQRQPDKLLIVNIIVGVIRLLIFYMGETLITMFAYAPIPDALYIFLLIVVVAAMIAVNLYIHICFALVYYQFFDHPKWSSVELLLNSREMMYGWKWEMFKMLFSFIGWFVLGLLSFGIGFIWIIPYIDLTISRFYEENFGNERPV